MKVCTKCSNNKDESEFYKDKRFGLTHWCKNCFRKSHKNKQQENPALWAERHRIGSMKSYYEHNEERKESLRKRQATPEAKSYQAEWKRSPKGKVHVARYNARRREMTKNDEKISLADIYGLLDKQQNLCLGCTRSFTEELPYTLDHLIPVSKGGVLRIDNIQLLCQPCNSSKGNRITTGG